MVALTPKGRDLYKRLCSLVGESEDGPSSDLAAWRRQQDLIENRQLKEARRRIKSMEMQVEFLSTMNSMPWTAEEFRAADLSSN